MGIHVENGIGYNFGGMQKSRSSSSVGQSISKRIFRPNRSRSSNRVPSSSWTPQQGSCTWTDGCGRVVRLGATTLLALSDAERRALQQVALARLHQLNLGSGTIRIPEDSIAVASKPKRRPHLLKKKSLTTGFFDTTRTDKEKTGDGSSSVFGVPLSQCVESEQARRQHLGSRTSLASLGALERERGDDSESCDSSGEWASTGSERLQFDDSSGGLKVPALVSACLAHLRAHGLHTVGLFRVSSAKKRVRQLREEWERIGGGGEFLLSQDATPHDVANLLKEFLRDLPDPLLCRDLYHAFLSTQKIRNRNIQLEAVKLLVQLLPPAHRDTLHDLLSFLAELAAHAEDDKMAPGNKMDASNLATVFAPNILHRSKPGDPTSAEPVTSREEQADLINVVRLLIEKHDLLWALPAELLHESYINLAETQPAHLDHLLKTEYSGAAERTAPAAEDDCQERRVWSREECLHGNAATGGPDRDVPSRGGTGLKKSRRVRDLASDTSTISTSSARTAITTRVRSSVEECVSSGVACSTASATPRDSADSNSDYNETACGSDEDSCVITASLHIPGPIGRDAPRRPAAPPRRRRSTSGSDTSKRDSAVGSGTAPSSAQGSGTCPSSPASWTSSPPSSPPPATPVRVTLTSTGEIRERRRQQTAPHSHTTTDMEQFIHLGRQTNTSDERAGILRQRDGGAAPTLYRRNELISSSSAKRRQ